MVSVDDRLATAWEYGVHGGDAAALRTLADASSGHPRSAELRAFATLATLVAGEGFAICPQGPLTAPQSAASAYLVGRAAEAWRAADAHDGQRAAHALGEIDAALAAAATKPSDGRLGVARAWADLALAQCSRTAGDERTAARRLRAVLGGHPPDALAFVALLALARAPLRSIPPSGAELGRRVSFLDRAIAVADRAARPLDAAAARIGAAVLLVASGATEQAAARLRSLAADADATLPEPLRVMAQMIIAVTSSGEQTFPELATALRTAAETGDYLGYVTLITLGSRLYARRGFDVDALATLAAGIVQLERNGPAMAAPLRDEGAKLREMMGEKRYRAAADALLAGA